MNNIFDQATVANINSRLEKLQPDSKALWGKMNVAQMLSHIQVPMEVALGDKKLKRTLIGLLFGRIAREKLFTEKPFPENLPTDPSFIRKGEHNFGEEKQKVTLLINRFVSGGESGLSQLPHPFFGKLTATEWGTSLWKHLDHHLRQFSV